MFIETRNLEGYKVVYLVDNPTERCTSALNCSQDCFSEYGDGKLLFLFEAAGLAYQPAIVDLVHADSKGEVEYLVQIRNYQRFRNKTLIRKFDELQLVVDERTIIDKVIKR